MALSGEKSRVQQYYHRFVPTYRDCQHCSIAQYSCCKCHYRGYMPPQILFIGEAPGESEIVLNGVPFVGRAGKLLDHWIQSVIEGGVSFTHGCMNLVACRPCDGPSQPNRKPTSMEIANCIGRFTALLQLAKPTAIVLLGRVARDNLPSWVYDQWGNKILSLIHPAAVCRMGGIKSCKSRECIRKLRTFVVEMVK